MPPSPVARQAIVGSPSPADVLRSELAACIDRFAAADGVNDTPLSKLRLIRTSRVADVAHVLYEPAMCLLARGRKRVVVGNEVVTYDALHHLVASHHIPVAGQVVEASDDSPYLCVWLDLDPASLSTLVVEQRQQCSPPETPPSALGIYASATGEPLLRAVLRLVRLLDTPQHIAALAPLAIREIMYWLLVEPEGWRLAQFVTPGTPTYRISVAINRLREQYQAPLRIDDLARSVHMSPSSLHAHFKAVTGMSPLQYQKRLRLQEARRLLMCGSNSVAEVAHRVGYESPSQFGREYVRMFGVTPARDMRRLRDPAGPFRSPDEARRLAAV